jgi:sugar phosphate isomerase/epimerase
MTAFTSIGAQLYTLREHTKTPLDFAKTCARLRQMGYRAVQVSAVGPMETTELAKILNGEGLACAATHVGMDMMRDTQKCVDYHAMLGCRYPAIGGFKAPINTSEAYIAFAREYSTIADQLAPHGLTIGYHNHSRELASVDDCSDRILDILIKSTSKAVWFEIDTYWIAHGGGDPAAWIRKVPGRLPCLHVKDMSVTVSQEQKMSEVGSGNLNWPAILEASKAAGVEWYLVERDRGDLDPFDSLKISLENMQAMGLS